MKKICFYVLALCMLLVPVVASAYTYNGNPGATIGDSVFNTYGMNVSDIYNTGGFTIDIFTNYPKAGVTVGSSATTPADLFIFETYRGNQYTWAIPLVTHGEFLAGTLYAVGTFKTSDDFAPGGGYIYNHNIPVQIATPVGSNYGRSSIGSGSVQWIALSGQESAYDIRIVPDVYQDDPNGSFAFLWGTATCANNVLDTRSVPEVGTLILLGVGLFGIAFYGRKSNMVLA